MSTLKSHLNQLQILTVIFDNASSGNSFGLDEVEQLQSIITGGNNLKGLVFESSPGKFFCAGGNLKKYANESKKQGLEANRKITKVLKSLEFLNCPTVAIVEGDCIGGGMELVSCFDYILASPDSGFGLWQRKNALTFGWGGGQRLLKRMSKATLQRLSLETNLLNSYKAKDVGLVDAILPVSLLRQEAYTWLLKQLELPVSPIEIIKAGVLKNEANDFNKNWFSDEHLSKLEKYRKN